MEFEPVHHADTDALDQHQVVVSGGNSSAQFSLSVTDSTPATLNVTVTSANPTVADSTNFTVSGSYPTYTLTVAPNANQFGTNQITVNVADGQTTTSTNLTLWTLHVHVNPTITLNTNTVTTSAGVATTNLTATLNDVDPTFHPVSSLTLSASSDNTNLVNPSDVVFDGTTGANRGFVIVPSGSGTGTANVSINVLDGVSTNSVFLAVNVLPISHALFGNSNAIVLSASGASTPNPSSIAVSGASPGLLGKVTVSLNNASNIVPSASGFSVILTPPVGAPVQPCSQAPLFLEPWVTAR